MDERKLRAWWWARQGLDGSLEGASAAAALERSGWMRSVGGAGPYLGLFARAGLGRAAVDEAASRLEIHELPSARGCTYVLPARDFELGLRLGQPFGSAAEIATAKKHLGVTEEELARLNAAVLAALEGGPLDPRQLKDALGDAVRGLGPEGKKRGQTTTLPLALGWLQSQGQIRRVPLDGRLDRQRYAYARWSEALPARDPQDDLRDLAGRYFGWVGTATLAQFQAFSGFGAKAVRAALESLGLGPLSPGDPRLILPEDRAALESFAVPEAPRPRFLSNLDGLLLHRREVAPLLDPADRERPIWTEKGSQAGGALVDLSHQAIVDRGRLIGLWDYDGLSGELVWATFDAPDAAVRAEAERVEAWIRVDLGDVRSFSLDSPESRKPRLDAIRALR